MKSANRAGKPISMCGQMCGNPLYTMLLLGLGLRSLSVTPAAVPEDRTVPGSRDAVAIALTGMPFAVLAVAVLGALGSAGEYGTLSLIYDRVR